MKIKLLLIILFSGFMFGCSNTEVQPWEKGALADPDMAPDSSPLTSALDDHIYFSKEATSGGRGFSGGGCGCN